jgi:hypothetical protein
LLSSVRIEQVSAGDHALDFAYIHGTGSFELRQSLLACAETGLIIFYIALIAFPGHPASEALNTRALAFQDRLANFVEMLGFNREAPKAS